MERVFTVQFSASAALTAITTASRFSTGRAPGSPRQTGQVLVLGGAPNLVVQPQKIFERVSNWQWTSRPMTGSYFPFSNSALSTLPLATLMDLLPCYESAEPPPRQSVRARLQS